MVLNMKVKDYIRIINLDYESIKKVGMPISKRAAQFAPFSALKGYEEALEQSRVNREAKLEKQNYYMVDESSWGDFLE